MVLTQTSCLGVAVPSATHDDSPDLKILQPHSGSPGDSRTTIAIAPNSHSPLEMRDEVGASASLAVWPRDNISQPPALEDAQRVPKRNSMPMRKE